MDLQERDVAERATLGACLVSSEALQSVAGYLNPDDFASNPCRLLFDVLRQMYSNGIPVDIITVPDELQKRGIFDRIGGTPFIDSLTENVAFSGNVTYYAKIIRDTALRRKILTASQRISQLVSHYDKDIPAIMDEAEKLLSSADQNVRSEEFRHVREMAPSTISGIVDRMKDRKRVIGYASGFRDLDRLTGGFQPGSLNIIAARPSMGKTALALNIAQFGGASKNAPVLVFSLEMPAEQIVQRMISAESGIDLSRLSRGLLDSHDFEMARNACDVVAQRNIFINDSTTLSAMEFRSRCRRFKMRYPELALVVVDYLQLMSSGEQAARTANRQQEVSDISRMLKATAREMNCPVIALSQLSRQTENRTDKKPQLADLRDSGAIEQDADVVMMMYREDYYKDNENNDLTDSQADIRVAKNRNGSTGMFHLTFQRETTRFYNFGEI